MGEAQDLVIEHADPGEPGEVGEVPKLDDQHQESQPDEVPTIAAIILQWWGQFQAAQQTLNWKQDASGEFALSLLLVGLKLSA